RVALRANWRLNDVFTFRAAGQILKFAQSNLFVNNTIAANRTYTQVLFNRSPEEIYNRGAYGFIDAKFNTGFLRHQATLGYSIHAYTSTDTSALATINVPGTFRFDAPTFAPQPPLTNILVPPTPLSRFRYDALTFADEVHITDKLSVIVGVTDASIDS